GVRLTVDTDEGAPATVTVRFLTRRTLEVALDPPAPETVAAFGDRLRSPRRERGYGLAVAGTTFGLFDLAKTDPRVVRFRFETGTTPASRRLVVHLFAGPDYP